MYPVTLLSDAISEALGDGRIIFDYKDLDLFFHRYQV